MPKNKTTSYCSIDIRTMKRAGWLKPDESLRWNLPGFGCPLNVRMVTKGIWISYRDRKGCSIDYLIPIARTDCHIKGSRPWFCCPACGSRVAILYAKDTGMFACRTCHDLAYPSQSEAFGDRANRGANNLRRRLGWKVGIANPEGDRPKGMHWATFEKMRNRHAAYAQAAFMDTARILGMIHRANDG